MDSLSTLVNEVVEELRERLQDEFTDEPHDIIHEIADSSVPVYTYDLMQLGAENLFLATDEPELGPAFDGSPTPVNIIAANIYEYLEQRLWETYEQLKDAEILWNLKEE